MDIACACFPHYGKNLTFSSEKFPRLNQVNLGKPNRFVRPPQFATITMRQILPRNQLGARLSF